MCLAENRLVPVSHVLQSVTHTSTHVTYISSDCFIRTELQYNIRGLFQPVHVYEQYDCDLDFWCSLPIEDLLFFNLI